MESIGSSCSPANIDSEALKSGKCRTTTLDANTAAHAVDWITTSPVLAAGVKKPQTLKKIVKM